MSLVQVREKAQITLPADIRRTLDIKEGDYLEADIEEDKVVFVPKLLSNKIPILKRKRYAFLSAAGSWKDVDTESLKRKIYENRKVSEREEVKL